MKTARVTLMALALACTAGLARAESGRPTQRDQGGVQTDYGQDRRVKSGTDQTFNTGPTGQDVGKDQPAPVSGADQSAAADVRDHGARGTGVATGFVAAGIGLAILGLFVRRRSRYGDEGDDDTDTYGRGPGSYGGGSGTQTKE